MFSRNIADTRAKIIRKMVIEHEESVKMNSKPSVLIAITVAPSLVHQVGIDSTIYITTWLPLYVTTDQGLCGLSERQNPCLSNEGDNADLLYLRCNTLTFSILDYIRILKT